MFSHKKSVRAVHTPIGPHPQAASLRIYTVRRSSARTFGDSEAVPFEGFPYNDSSASGARIELPLQCFAALFKAFLADPHACESVVGWFSHDREAFPLTRIKEFIFIPRLVNNLDGCEEPGVLDSRALNRREQYSTTFTMIVIPIRAGRFVIGELETQPSQVLQAL
jgi:hypothetical protein